MQQRKLQNQILHLLYVHKEVSVELETSVNRKKINF